MRKLITTITMTVILGMLNVVLVCANANAGVINLMFQKQVGEKNLKPYEYSTSNQSIRYQNIGYTLSNSLDPNDILPSGSINQRGSAWNRSKSTQPDPSILRMQRQVAEIHKSVTNSPTSKIVQKDKNNLLLKAPQSIYDYDIDDDGEPTNYREKQAKVADSVPDFFRKALSDEQKFRRRSTSSSRKAIDQRRQYAATIDKAVSLSIFQETENHFNQISELLNEIHKATELKDIIAVQTRIQAQLAIIQNETIKLQTIAHLRNAEQALIDRLQRQRNKLILRLNNDSLPGGLDMKMPTIRYTKS
ncbi:type IV secretion system protein [Bartonella sp. B10]